MVVVETVVVGSLPKTNANPTKKTRPKRPGRPSMSPDAKKKCLWIPKHCAPAIQQLKEELHLRSEGDTILWLLRQVRPELLLLPPLPPLPPNINSLPTCMHPLEKGSQLTKRPHVRATVVQASTCFFDTPATLDKAERLVAMAAAYGSQLIVFPEAFIGGYPRCVALNASALPEAMDSENEFLRYYASAINVPGPEVERISKLSENYKVHLVMGVVERVDSYLYSTVVFFDSHGQLMGHNRKLMLLESESMVWYKGEKSSVPVFETSIGRIGGLICWDNESLSQRSELYAKGVEIYCTPSADAGDRWIETATRIALEGGCFVLSPNQFCRRRDYLNPPGGSISDVELDEIESDGGSIIVSPSGAILAGPNYQGECLISADLDLGDTKITKIKPEGNEE